MIKRDSKLLADKIFVPFATQNKFVERYGVANLHNISNL